MLIVYHDAREQLICSLIFFFQKTLDIYVQIVYTNSVDKLKQGGLHR